MEGASRGELRSQRLGSLLAMIHKPGPSTQRARRRTREREYAAARRMVWELRADKHGAHWCEGCGAFLTIDAAHCHHRVHRSQGGTNDINNLDLLCQKCHARMHGITVK